MRLIWLVLTWIVLPGVVSVTGRRIERDKVFGSVAHESAYSLFAVSKRFGLESHTVRSLKARRGYLSVSVYAHLVSTMIGIVSSRGEGGRLAIS